METFSALLAICAGNSPATGEFPTQRPVTRSFDVFFDLRLINGWINNGEAGDLRRHRTHYDVIVMHESWVINLVSWLLASPLDVSSAAMILSLHDKHSLAVHEERFQLIVPRELLDMIENVNAYSYFICKIITLETPYNLQLWICLFFRL